MPRFAKSFSKLYDPVDCLAGLTACTLAKRRECLLQPLDLSLGFLAVVHERILQLVALCGLPFLAAPSTVSFRIVDVLHE